MRASRSIRRWALLPMLFLSTATIAFAADPEPPARLTAQEDHDRMAKLLGVTDIRPGAAGRDRNDPNWAPYDEAKANAYTSLPDPLTTNDGRKVTSQEMWWNVRRPEIVELFDREVYGRMPPNVPKVTWEVASISNGQTGSVPTLAKQLRGHVDNSAYPLIDVNIQLTLTIPANAVGPVPVMMVFGGGFAGPAAVSLAGRSAVPGGAPGAVGGRIGRFGAAPGAPAAAPATQPTGGEPTLVGRGAGARGTARGPLAGGFGGSAGPGAAEQILVRGWAYATLNPSSIQADNGGWLTQGIIGLVNKGQPRKPDDWGALRAWAWGVSRAIDYFETDPQVNAKMVGLEGHSRYGKGTIVAMAYEPRLALGFPSSSGSGGAHINRRRFGEKVENVGGVSEYHWMAGNFIKYTGTVNGNVLTADDIPVDGHELVALCAPRPVFISGGIQQSDAWQDPKGMFLAGFYATPVYELLGAKGIGAKEYPKPMTFIASGDIAFREHEQGHTDGPSWPYFLEWASRYMKLPSDLSGNLSPVAPKTPPDGVLWEYKRPVMPATAPAMQ